MRLPVSAGVAVDELTASMKIIQEWVAELQQGVPHIDRPGTDDELENWLRNLRGELLYVSDKCAALAVRMTELE